MRKFGIIAVLALMVTALAAVPALAANTQFNKGPSSATSGRRLRLPASLPVLGGRTLD